MYFQKGKKQHYQLGQYTRQRYDGFFPEFYNNSFFYIESTDVDRTLMSAESNVAGIFPPIGPEVWKEKLDWQPIPIHPGSEEIINSVPDCITYYTETSYVMAEAKFLPSGINYTELYEYLTEHSGSTVNSIISAYFIEDDLRLEEAMGYELPEWTKAVYPEPLKTIAGSFFVATSYTDNQKRLSKCNFFYKNY